MEMVLTWRRHTKKFPHNNVSGWYKRTQTAALRQAKFYLPWQAAAPQLIYCGAAVHEVLQYTKDSFVLVYCSSSTAAAIKMAAIWPQ